MTKRHLMRHVLVMMLSFCSLPLLAAPVLSSAVIAELENDRFLEMPMQALTASFIKRLVEAGYTTEQATNLTHQILNHANNSKSVGEIVAQFNQSMSQDSHLLTPEVRATLDSISRNTHVCVTLGVSQVQGSEQMDAALDELGRQGATVSGQGCFPLESMPPQGGRTVTLKTKAHADGLVNIVNTYRSPIGSLKAEKVIAPIGPSIPTPQPSKPRPTPAPITPVGSSKEMVEGSFIMGARWLLDVVHGRPVDNAEVDILKKFNRIIPYGRTVEGVRTETWVFRIALNQSRAFLVYPSPGKLKILFGATVSPEMREAADANSAYLFEPAPGNEEFLAVFTPVGKFGKRVLVQGQSLFNREVQQVANLVLTDLDLQTTAPREVLTTFMLALYDSCDDLLTRK